MAKTKKQPIETTTPLEGGNVPTSLAHAETTHPWHGFGETIQPGESVYDTMARAGLDFEVALSPLHYGTSILKKNEGEEQAAFEERQKEESSNPPYFTTARRALYRTDNGTLFDTPRGGYHPIQNRDMVALFEEYVKSGDMTIDTMGAFEQGRKGWLLADMNQGFDVGATKKQSGGDVVLGKILFYMPHIYGEGVFHKTTSISVVCSNTLEAAKREKSEVFRLWHNVEWNAERAAQAKMNLEASRQQFLGLKEDAEILSKVKLSIAEARVFIALAVGDVKVAPSDQGRNFVKVVNLYEKDGRGMSLPSRSGTAWGLLNAVTEFEDWSYGTKRTSQASRLERAWLGAGALAKNKTRDMLVEFAKGEFKVEAWVPRFTTADLVEAGA